MTDKTSQEIHNYSRLALVGAAFAVTAWGSSGVIVKYISVSSTEIAIYRFTFYSIVMIAFLKAKGTPSHLSIYKDCVLGWDCFGTQCRILL